VVRVKHHAKGTASVALFLGLATMACGTRAEIESLQLPSTIPLGVVQQDSSPCSTEVWSLVSNERWIVGCSPTRLAKRDSLCTSAGARPVLVWHSPASQVCAFAGSTETLFHSEGTLVERVTLSPAVGGLLHYSPCLKSGVTHLSGDENGEHAFQLVRLGAVDRILASLKAGTILQGEAGVANIVRPARLVASSRMQKSFTFSTTRDSLVFILNTPTCSDEPLLDSLSLGGLLRSVSKAMGKPAVLVYADAELASVVVAIQSHDQLFRYTCDTTTQRCDGDGTDSTHLPVIAVFACADTLCSLQSTAEDQVVLVRHQFRTQ
jgi:hypothetical protein